MAFNNDVDVTKLFDQIYHLVTGNKPGGITILENRIFCRAYDRIFDLFQSFRETPFYSRPYADGSADAGV